MNAYPAPDSEYIDEDIVDEAASEPSSPVIYGISSYGADYSVDLIVKRMRNRTFVVPEFQRSYIWPIRKASRFVESLLLGLPVPAIFLYEEEKGSYLVVDGQQRLKTLQYFYDGTFGEKIFRLEDVQEKWKGKTYKDLSDSDRQKLDDALIHIIFFKQDVPSDDNSSIIHVFERINTGGMALYPQEIRTCVNHGAFTKLLQELNSNEDWRTVYGPVNKRMKDQELILRFLALLFDLKAYIKPMSEFLDKFIERKRRLSKVEIKKFKDIFTKTIALAREALGDRAFRPEKALNAAVYDACMVGMATRLMTSSEKPDLIKLKEGYNSLLSNDRFRSAYSVGTSQEDNVRDRIRLAKETFKDC